MTIWSVNCYKNHLYLLYYIIIYCLSCLVLYIVCIILSCLFISLYSVIFLILINCSWDYTFKPHSHNQNTYNTIQNIIVHNDINELLLSPPPYIKPTRLPFYCVIYFYWNPLNVKVGFLISISDRNYNNYKI